MGMLRALSLSLISGSAFTGVCQSSVADGAPPGLVAEGVTAVVPADSTASSPHAGSQRNGGIRPPSLRTRAFARGPDTEVTNTSVSAAS
jgi:hypothetical protein